VILPISSLYIGRTLEDFCPIRLNGVECPNAWLGREEIDCASDCNAIAGQELKCAMARERTAQMQLAELWYFPALRRATITSAVANVDIRKECLSSAFDLR
jgi:hypothetical protein